MECFPVSYDLHDVSNLRKWIHWGAGGLPVKARPGAVVLLMLFNLKINDCYYYARGKRRFSCPFSRKENLVNTMHNPETR
jgi:hypothetical protein